MRITLNPPKNPQTQLSAQTLINTSSQLNVKNLLPLQFRDPKYPVYIRKYAPLVYQSGDTCVTHVSGNVSPMVRAQSRTVKPFGEKCVTRVTLSTKTPHPL